jgi:hypothetical protein
MTPEQCKQIAELINTHLKTGDDDKRPHILNYETVMRYMSDFFIQMSELDIVTVDSMLDYDSLQLYAANQVLSTLGSNGISTS